MTRPRNLSLSPSEVTGQKSSIFAKTNPTNSTIRFSSAAFAISGPDGKVEFKHHVRYFAWLYFQDLPIQR